jgi:site-specific DNA recombinase
VDEQKEHEDAIARLKAEHDRLQHRLQAMYVDKLDGRIDNSFYVQMSEQWRLEQDKLMQEIIRHQVADRSYIDEGVRLIELAHGTQRLFLKQQANEQRQLLNFVLSNSTWKNGTLTPVFRQPFDLIAKTTDAAKNKKDGEALNSPGHPVWLGHLDSNQD